MTSEKFVKKAIAYSVGILILVSVIMIVIDPFCHYHMPFFGMEAVTTDERSALIGVTKNDTYDTLLLGSSMSENFIDSWFEDGVFGERTVKVCLQGAHFDDYEVILDEAIKHPELKNVVFGLDNYVLTDNPAEQSVTIPEYLSNDKISDDCYYLWNKSALTVFIPQLIIGNITENCSDDNAYTWEHIYPCSKELSLGNYMQFRPEGFEDPLGAYDYFPNADNFLERFTKYVEARPDIKFTVYAPPYSIMFWDYSIRKGRLEAEICLLDKVYESLLEYDNVEIYYFQNDYDIITNLDNYRDYSHYSQAVNYYMYQCMLTGKNRITKENCYDTLIEMYSYASTYDYDALFPPIY